MGFFWALYPASSLCFGILHIQSFSFFQLLFCICVTNLNISYWFVAQVVQRSRALVQGPWPLIQRPVTGARQKGWYERQVGLAQGRRQRRGGPLKTKLHPWPQHHSRLSIYNILMLNTLPRHPTPLFSRLPPFFALVQPECTHTIKYKIEFFCLVVSFPSCFFFF